MLKLWTRVWTGWPLIPSKSHDHRDGGHMTTAAVHHRSGDRVCIPAWLRFIASFLNLISVASLTFLLIQMPCLCILVYWPVEMVVGSRKLVMSNKNRVWKLTSVWQSPVTISMLVFINNNNGRNGSCLTWPAYLIEERRRWPVITTSPRGQCSK